MTLTYEITGPDPERPEQGDVLLAAGVRVPAERAERTIANVLRWHPDAQVTRRAEDVAA